jgi:hypothetical protein
VVLHLIIAQDYSGAFSELLGLQLYFVSDEAWITTNETYLVDPTGFRAFFFDYSKWWRQVLSKKDFSRSNIVLGWTIFSL